MPVTVRSFAKINLGLSIGALRPDGFHDLRTVYQTIALHDIIRVEVERGTGNEIRCEDPRVPKDASNTCYRIVERALEALAGTRSRNYYHRKRLPVQGGLGAGSGNAVATLLALERALKKKIPGAEKLRIAARSARICRCFSSGGRFWAWDTGKRFIRCLICRQQFASWPPRRLGFRPPRRLRIGTGRSTTAKRTTGKGTTLVVPPAAIVRRL